MRWTTSRCSTPAPHQQQYCPEPMQHEIAHIVIIIITTTTILFTIVIQALDKRDQIDTFKSSKADLERQMDLVSEECALAKQQMDERWKAYREACDQNTDVSNEFSRLKALQDEKYKERREVGDLIRSVQDSFFENRRFSQKVFAASLTPESCGTTLYPTPPALVTLSLHCLSRYASCSRKAGSKKLGRNAMQSQKNMSANCSAAGMRTLSMLPAGSCLESMQFPKLQLISAVLVNRYVPCALESL